MYTEEPKKSIDWSSVIKKGLVILVIALIIFLIIWLFTKNNNTNKNVDIDYNNDSNINEQIIDDNTAYSKEFIEGYRYFHDTSKEYFLISELPTAGQTLRYSLRELIDKGLMLPFSYKNNETCDLDASYVSVTNQNDKYNMTTTLVCGREVAKTTEELGCNQLCLGSNCKVTISDNIPSNPTPEIPKGIEYRFKQAYSAKENVYSCPKGYVPSGSGANTICQKGDKTTIDATKVVTYKCPDGYTPSGSGANTTCTKTISKSVDPICPDGYTPNTTNNKLECSKVVDNNKTVYADPICPDGYTPSGSGSNLKCSKTVTSTSTVTAKPSFSHYYCSSGTNLGNGQCKNTYYTYTYVDYGPTYNGCTYKGAERDWCGSSNCPSTRYKYLCTTYTSATAYYVCPSGYTPSGYVSASTTCKKTVTSTKTVYADPICPDGYTPSGSGSSFKCSKTTTSKETIKANPVCPKDAITSGSGANIKCTVKDTETKNAIKHTEYTCPSSDYTKFGSGTETKCTKGKIVSTDPIVSTKTVTKYKYQWSCSESLAGWERTGETRQSTKCPVNNEVSSK